MTVFLMYLFCLVVGGVFVLGCAVAGHIFGGGSDHVVGSGGHAEAGADSSDSPGISVFSPTVLACFLTSFGGFGVILTQFEGTKPAYISAPLSALGAVGVASIIVALLRFVFRRTDASSESHVASLVGQEATIITPIAENGVGEIAYVQSGTRYTAAVREVHGKAVANGRTVRIIKVTGSQFYVEEIH